MTDTLSTSAGPELWTPAQVASILGTTVDNIARMARSGYWLPAEAIMRTPGGQRRYWADLVETAFPAQVAAWRAGGAA